MGVKLVGEYEIVDDGVKIEGQIKDTKIPELVELFKPFGTVTLYAGLDKEGRGDRYAVPHPRFRPYLFERNLLKRDDECEFIKLESVTTINMGYYRDAPTFYNNMGIQYQQGAGRNVVDQARVYMLGSYRLQKSRILTNSAWVWNVRSDGEFKVHLRGLVNRHMMTMVIGNAARMANHLQFLSEKLLDKSKEFTADKIREAMY